MEKIKIGIYTARPDSELSPSALEKRTQLTAGMIAKAAEMIRRYYAEHFNAQQDTDELERMRRIDPKTGERVYEIRT